MATIKDDQDNKAVKQLEDDPVIEGGGDDLDDHEEIIITGARKTTNKIKRRYQHIEDEVCDDQESDLLKRFNTNRTSISQ